MGITDEILKECGFIKSIKTTQLEGDETTITTFTKEYNYYMGNTNTFKLSYFKNTKYNYPQFDGYYTLRINDVIVKSMCNDMDVINSIYNLLN